MTTMWKKDNFEVTLEDESTCIIEAVDFSVDELGTLTFRNQLDSGVMWITHAYAHGHWKYVELLKEGVE